jgi:pimeloyl-ACP methyl ester carboxylesterase
MSSFWRGTSTEKLQIAEDELFKHTGLGEGEYKSYPVNIEFGPSDWKEQDEEVTVVNNEDEYIWTIEFGQENQTKLVMIHGYGGSGMIFYQMFEELSKHFHIYLIDLLGMGRSSRNNFECETYDECERYFVNSIEKWRQNAGFEENVSYY